MDLCIMISMDDCHRNAIKYRMSQYMVALSIALHSFLFDAGNQFSHQTTK